MTRFVFISAILIIMISCKTGSSTKKNSDSAPVKNIAEENKMLQDSTLIKTWLTNVILDYLNSDDLKADYNNMRLALTDDYFEYKQDAIGLEYGDEMTEDEFHQKWKTKYDTKYVTKGGYFVSSQDYGKIEIDKCNFVKVIGDSGQVYHVVMRDLHWNTDYVRDFTIIKQGNKFLIDDVKEY